MTSKICNRCKMDKPLDCFSKRNNRTYGYKDGLEYYCKDCSNQRLREYRKNHHEEFLKSCNLYSSKNREKIRQYNRQYYQEHEEQYQERGRKYYSDNRDKCINRSRIYRQTYKNKIIAAKMAQKINIKNTVCSLCGIAEAQDRHHPDYNKPLTIIPLCKRCHLRLHAKQREKKYAEISI